jgi:hypothetical protein
MMASISFLSVISFSFRRKIRTSRKKNRGYLENPGWIRLIGSYHEEHEDHKGKTQNFTFILSCPSWLYMPHFGFLQNHINLLPEFCTKIQVLKKKISMVY